MKIRIERVVRFGEREIRTTADTELQIETMAWLTPVDSFYEELITRRIKAIIAGMKESE